MGFPCLLRGFDMRHFRRTGDVAEDVLAFLDWRGDGITFIELLRFIPELKGTAVIGPAGNASLAYWIGLSDKGVWILDALLEQGSIELEPVNPLLYALDGFVSNRPIAYSMRRYKDLRWYPVKIAMAAALRSSRSTALGISA